MVATKENAPQYNHGPSSTTWGTGEQRERRGLLREAATLFIGFFSSILPGWKECQLVASEYLQLGKGSQLNMHLITDRDTPSSPCSENRSGWQLDPADAEAIAAAQAGWNDAPPQANVMG